MRKIINLPGAALSPDVLLAQVLEEAAAGNVKACALVFTDGKDVVRFGWSRMQAVELAGLASYLMYQAMRDDEDGGAA